MSLNQIAGHMKRHAAWFVVFEISMLKKLLRVFGNQDIIYDRRLKLNPSVIFLNGMYCFSERCRAAIPIGSYSESYI